MSVAITVHDRLAPADDSAPLARPRCIPRGLIARLRCPVTGQPLVYTADGTALVADGVRYPVRNGVPLLLTGRMLEDATRWVPPSRIPLRQRLRSWIPAPVSAARQQRLLHAFLDRLAGASTIINIGSAGWELGPAVLNIDVLPYRSVGLCADIHRLPFGPGEVDAIVCTGVLEHIADPRQAVAEFRRVLRPGGEVFCTVPFMQPYHEDPVDYRRYTPTGLCQLYDGFSAARVQPSHGVGSALAWIAADCLAAALAGNANKLHTLWTVLFRVLFAPLRLLDRVGAGNRFEHIACSALLIEARR